MTGRRPQGADTPTAEQVADAINTWHAATLPEREPWESHPWPMVAFVADYLRAALASGGTAAPTDDQIARAFHAAYERLAPEHGHETRAATARPWADIPEQSRALMIATVHEVREWLAGQPSLADLDAAARTPQPAPDGEETP